MTLKLTSTERVQTLAPEGLSALAGLIDQAIQDTFFYMKKERGSVTFSSETHHRIRGAILYREVHENRENAEAAGKPQTRLEELGIRMIQGPSESIIIDIAGHSGRIRVMHRPKVVSDAPILGAEGLFELDHAPMYLFYTEEAHRLGSLALVESWSDRNSFFINGCAAVDQLEVPRDVMVAPTSNTKKTDELSEFFRQVARMSEVQEETAAEQAPPKEATTDS